MLPDTTLLEIFDFYVDGGLVEMWQTLVHVCQNWRNIVFGSPRRLDLQLFCRAKAPMRLLDVWPPLPIAIRISRSEVVRGGVENVLPALEHIDRVCELELYDAPYLQLNKVLTAMQRPYPKLTHLLLQPYFNTSPVVPDSFLGGSAPSLSSLTLDCIPFPGLPKLLLSTSHLARLHLSGISFKGYISPEVMVTSLSALTRLKSLHIGFGSPHSFPGREGHRSPPQTRSLLPVLTKLSFQGVCEYLEDLMAQIDAPLLHTLEVNFFRQKIFDIPQLTQFITQKFKTHDEAHVNISESSASVKLPQASGGSLRLENIIVFPEPDPRLSTLKQVCSMFPQAIIPAVEHLHIQCGLAYQLYCQDVEWQELFLLFPSVKDLHLSQEVMKRIASTPEQFVGERGMEVLPALQTLSLEYGKMPFSLVTKFLTFVAARHLSGHPLAISRWERES
jgi:hypothetical protein